MNSPESNVFHKGRLLYNLHNAKHAIRKAGRAVLVEGYFDVIRCVEAGVENVVAPLGTAFSGDRATLLKRFASEVIVLYDSDTAGMKASFRVCDELLRASVRASVATAPPGEDPDTLVRDGGAPALEQVLNDAMDVFERKLQLIERKGWLETLSGRRNALDRLLPTLRATADPVTRDLYVGRAAQQLGITADSIRREMATGASAPTTPHARVAHDEPAAPKHRMRPERDLVNAMLHDPVWRSVAGEQLRDPTQLGQPERELFEHLRDAPEDVRGPELLEVVSPPARQMLQELLEENWSSLRFGEIVDGAISRIQSRQLEAQLRELHRRHDLVDDREKPGIQAEIMALRQKISVLNPARWPVIRG